MTYSILIKDYDSILNDPDLFSDLSHLTNSGDALSRFGSALLDGLNNVYPLKFASIITYDGIPVAWGAIILTESVYSGHVFVSKKYRQQGLGGIIVESLLEIHPSLYFSRTDDISFKLYSKYQDIRCIA
jgi:hypothetical protein